MEARLAAAPAGAPRVDWWRASADVRRPVDADAGRPRAGSTAYAALLGFTFVLLLAPQTYLPVLAHLRIALALAVVALAAHLLHCLNHRSPVLPRTSELWTALALVLWAAATAPMSYWPGGSVSLLLELYFKAFAVFFLLVGVVDTPRRLRRLCGALVLLSVPLALTAVGHYLSGIVTSAGTVHARVVGYQAPLTQNPNDLALMLNLVLPLGLAGVAVAPRGLWRAGVIAAAGLLAGAVILTFSRAGFLSLATTGAFYLIRLARRGRHGLAVAVLVLVLVAIPVLPDGYLSRLATIFDVNADPTGSARVRWDDTVWAVRFVLDNPILGAGAGMNVLALNELRGPAWKAVHNVYLEYAVDLGLPGLILFLLLLGQCWRSTALVERLCAGRPDRAELAALAEGLRASLLAFSVSGLFHPVAYHFYFFYFAGLAIAARRVLAVAGGTPR